MKIAEIQEQVRQLKAAKGFDLTLEQRLAYLTTEVGEVTREALKLRGFLESGVRNGEAPEETARKLGMEIYDVVWNLFDLADIAGVNLEEAFVKKAELNESREWKIPYKNQKNQSKERER